MAAQLSPTAPPVLLGLNGWCGSLAERKAAAFRGALPQRTFFDSCTLLLCTLLLHRSSSCGGDVGRRALSFQIQSRMYETASIGLQHLRAV